MFEEKKGGIALIDKDLFYDEQSIGKNGSVCQSKMFQVPVDLFWCALEKHMKS